MQYKILIKLWSTIANNLGFIKKNYVHQSSHQDDYRSGEGGDSSRNRSPNGPEVSLAILWTRSEAKITERLGSDRIRKAGSRDKGEMGERQWPRVTTLHGYDVPASGRQIVAQLPQMEIVSIIFLRCFNNSATAPNFQTLVFQNQSSTLTLQIGSFMCRL